MNFIQAYMIEHNYGLIHLYFFLVFVSVIIRFPIILLTQTICSHTDGGGWDAGTAYSYVPTLKKTESIAQNYFLLNRRVKVLSWFILPLIPFYWFIQVFFVLLYLYCRAEFYLTYGHISSLIEKHRYESTDSQN